MKFPVVLPSDKSTEGRFTKKVGVSGKIRLLQTKFGVNFFCHSQGLNPQPLTQCKGKGKERSIYRVMPPGW